MIRPWRRSAWPWLLLGVVAVGISGRLLLDPLAGYVTRRGFAQAKGYRADFRAVRVNLLRPAYIIEGLTISRSEAARDAQPQLYIDRLSARPIIANPLKAEITGLATVEGLVAQGSISAQSVEASTARLQKFLPSMEAFLRRFLPLKVNRIELHKAELRLINVSDETRPELRIDQLDAALENFATERPRSARGPTVFAAHMRVQKAGDLSIFLIADPRAETPTFAGQVELSEFSLAEVSKLLLQRNDPSNDRPAPSGKLNLFISVQSKKGMVSGGIRSMLTNVPADSDPEELGATLQAGLGEAPLELHPEPGFRPDSMTVTPIRGQITDARAELWPTVSGVFRSALAKGLAMSLEGSSVKAPKMKLSKRHERRARIQLAGEALR